ncbi:MAG: hypothetical protein J5775_00420, partial [Spirochaetales bacterium]|nr:hypothetical protein [Spirochaetales bacterium]
YRTAQTQAVMSEFMAASLLYRSDWYRKLRTSIEEGAAEGPVLLDPFCGSGTICIEAALMATNTAPGLLKQDSFAFLGLPIHDEELWQETVAEAQAQRRENTCRIIGWDIDRRAVDISTENARKAGLEGMVEFAVRDFTTVTEADVPLQADASSPTRPTACAWTAARPRSDVFTPP